MVGEHLCMVFPALLDVDDEYLLDPEGQLYKVVPFKRSGHLSRRPGGPDFGIVKPVNGVIPEVLWFSASVFTPAVPVQELQRIWGTRSRTMPKPQKTT